MTNADKFKQIFGLYATELWSKTEGEFLVWLNSDFKQSEITNSSDVPDINVGDIISRKDALFCLTGDITNKSLEEYISIVGKRIRKLQPAQPEQQNARIFQEIIVEYPSISTYTECEGKPCFLIKYKEDGQDFIGYGTYKPDVLSEYLKEYFIPSAQPEQDREFMRLKVRNLNGRPYYSIIYLEFDDNGLGHDFEGYSSYSLDVISDYLKKYFMPSAQPEIIHCKECKWYGRVDKRRFYRGMDCLQKRIDTIVPDRDFCSRGEKKENE